MYKQLRKRFVAAAMAGMLLVTLIVVGAINVFNYIKEQNTINDTLLFVSVMKDGFPGRRNPQNITSGGDGRENPGEIPEKSPEDVPTHIEKAPFDIEDNMEDLRRDFKRLDINDETGYVTRFFRVDFDHEGNIYKTDISNIASFTEDEANEIAAGLYKGDSQQGRKGSYYYKETLTAEGSTFIYLDCNQIVAQGHRLFLISFGVAIGSLLFELIVLLLLSKKVVKPVVESIEKQKSFITDASHELKTPLTIISANTEVLEMTEGANEWTESIKNQTGRLSKLVNELVYLAKMDEEKRTLTMEKFSLSGAVSETVMPYETVAAGKNIAFLAEIEENISYYGDEAAVRQLISIFMENAVKYTAENEEGKKEIRVSLKKKGKKAELRFFNTCENIEAEDMKRLFERFYRVDKSRSRETGGSGIGLSVAKAISEKHRGMEVSAKSERKGTIEFAVTFESKNK